METKPKAGDIIELNDECIKIIGGKKREYIVESTTEHGLPRIAMESGRHWTISSIHYKIKEEGRKIKKIKEKIRSGGQR